MNKDIVSDWLKELKAFSKLSNSRQLRFPMFMESNIGDLLSPEGILCNLHAKACNGKWYPEKSDNKHLRGSLFYDNSAFVAPDSVLKWIDLPPSVLCQVRNSNGDGGFEAVIDLVTQWLKEDPKL